jgi:hypothetical protein
MRLLIVVRPRLSVLPASAIEVVIESIFFSIVSGGVPACVLEIATVRSIREMVGMKISFHRPQHHKHAEFLGVFDPKATLSAFASQFRHA